MKSPYILPGWALLYLPLTSARRSITIRNVPSTVTITAPAPSSPPSESYTTDSKLIDSALNSTNHFRAQHNAPPLTWNTSLADAAASWASNCQWKHSNGPTGENLALGYPDMASAIDAWGNERDMYDFGASVGFSKETGHFTQLVWKETESMGCAAVDCKGKNDLKGHIVVCEYWPPGNMVGEGNKYFRKNVEAKVEVKTPLPVGVEVPPVQVEVPTILIPVDTPKPKPKETPQPSPSSSSPPQTTEQAPPPPTTTLESTSTELQTITLTATVVVPVSSKPTPTPTSTPTSTSPQTNTRTATLIPILPSNNLMVAAAPAAEPKSTVWALGGEEEGGADKLHQAKWAMVVTVAAVLVAAALG